MVKCPTTHKLRWYTMLRCIVNLIHALGCCCFPDINISQGSVATHLSVVVDALLLLSYKFIEKSIGERI